MGVCKLCGADTELIDGKCYRCLSLSVYEEAKIESASEEEEAKFAESLKGMAAMLVTKTPLELMKERIAGITDSEAEEFKPDYQIMYHRYREAIDSGAYCTVLAWNSAGKEVVDASRAIAVCKA